jgi:hypothetical protein
MDTAKYRALVVDGRATFFGQKSNVTYDCSTVRAAVLEDRG